MASAKITDHSTQAIERLPGFEQGSSNWGKLLRALTVPIQDLEDALDQLFNERAISTAIGAQLDGIGTILDLARSSGQSDALYRTALFAKAGTLFYSGEPEALIAIYTSLVDASLVVLTEPRTATVQLVGTVTAIDNDALQGEYWDEMNTVRVAGVILVLELEVLPAFTLSDDSEVDGSGNGPQGSGDDGGWGDDLDSGVGGGLHGIKHV